MDEKPIEIIATVPVPGQEAARIGIAAAGAIAAALEAAGYVIMRRSDVADALPVYRPPQE